MNSINTTYIKSLVIFTFLIIVTMFSQSQTKVDSLMQKLETTPEKEQLSVLNQIIVAYFFIDSVDKSIEYAQKLLELARDQENIPNEALALNKLGYGYFSKDELQTALNYFMDALNIAKDNNLKAQISISYHGIGRVYTKWGKYEKALEMFQAGLDYIDEKEIRNFAVFNNAIAIVYQNQECSGALRTHFFCVQLF